MDDCHFEAGKSVAKYRGDDRLQWTESSKSEKNEKNPNNMIMEFMTHWNRMVGHIYVWLQEM